MEASNTSLQAQSMQYNAAAEANKTVAEQIDRAIMLAEERVSQLKQLKSDLMNMSVLDMTTAQFRHIISF